MIVWVINLNNDNIYLQQSDWKCDVCGEFCSYDVCECDTCGQVRADHDPQDTESVTIQTTPEQPRPKETLTEDSHGSIAKVDGNASERFMTPKNTVGVSPVTSSLVVQSAVRQTVREDSHGSIATDDGNASGRYMTPINTVGVSPHTTSIINSSELRTYTDEPRVLGKSAGISNISTGLSSKYIIHNKTNPSNSDTE